MEKIHFGQAGGVFDALSEHFALGLTAGDIKRLVAVYRGHKPDIRPCRGVEGVLASIARRGMKLAVLSDGFLPAQRLKFRALGLAKYFDEVIFTEQMGRDAWKPSPRGFESIRRSLGVPDATCAYVGDNPSKDFLAPNALGWLSVQWFRRGQIHADKPAPKGGKPKVIVRSGSQLLRLFR